MIEPVTLALIAGFMVAPAPTRIQEWRLRSYEPPIREVASKTNLLINPSVNTAPSERMMAALAGNVSVMDKMASIALELDLYASLDAEWDGPDSRPPTQVQIQDAQNLLTKLPAGLPIPKPMLSATGSIGLYWDNQKVFADIALEGDGKFSLFVRLKSGSRAETFADDVQIANVNTEWLAQNLSALFDV